MACVNEVRRGLVAEKQFVNSGQHVVHKTLLRNTWLCIVHPCLCNKLQSENKITDFCNKRTNIPSRCLPSNRDVAHHVKGVEFHGGLLKVKGVSNLCVCLFFYKSVGELDLERKLFCYKAFS